MADSQVKGTSLRGNLEAAQQLYGTVVVERAIERLSTEHKQAVRTGLLVSGWYPIAWMDEFYRVLMQELPQAQNAPEVVSRRAVEIDMKGIYGFLTRFLSPEFCIRQAPRVLGTYYKGPRIEAKVLSHGHAELHFAECHGFGRFAWRDIVAGAQRIFEEAGARNPRLTFVSGGRDGDARALVDVRWS